MNLTERFAKFLKETDASGLPEQTLAAAKERLLDTIGAMLAGRAGWTYGDALAEAMRPLGTGNHGIVGGNRERCFPAARAAMLDATFAHAMELDDGHQFAGVHAGAVIVPTALVMGEALHATGAEVLTAIVLGYEIVYRLAVAQSPHLIDRGFHPSATCGTVGAMAAAGKLMKLNEAQLASGLGMAGLQASGLMEATVSGQQSKCVMVGNAAYSGISCAYAASAGLEGCPTVFEGKTGLFQAMGRPRSAEEVADGLGRRYLIADTYNKFYPTCRHAQPAIEAVLNLSRAHRIDPAQVRRIEVGTHPVACRLTGQIRAPRNPGEAKFSIAYGAAAALVDHGVAVRHLQEQAYTQRRYLDLAERVEVFEDGEVSAQYPKRRGAKVRIVMKDGKAFEGECYDLKGSPRNPAGFEELVQKFQTAAAGLLADGAIREVQDRCAAFERETDLGAFLALLRW